MLYWAIEIKKKNNNNNNDKKRVRSGLLFPGTIVIDAIGLRFQ